MPSPRGASRLSSITGSGDTSVLAQKPIRRGIGVNRWIVCPGNGHHRGGFDVRHRPCASSGADAGRCDNGGCIHRKFWPSDSGVSGTAGPGHNRKQCEPFHNCRKSQYGPVPCLAPGKCNRSDSALYRLLSGADVSHASASVAALSKMISIRHQIA